MALKDLARQYGDIAAIFVFTVVSGLNSALPMLRPMPPKIEYKDVNKDGIINRITYSRALIFPEIYWQTGHVQYGIKSADGKIAYTD